MNSNNAQKKIKASAGIEPATFRLLGERTAIYAKRPYILLLWISVYKRNILKTNIQNNKMNRWMISMQKQTKKWHF